MFREFTEDVKAAYDVAEVLGRYVDLNESNTGLCPFHPDSRPSLKVYPDAQVLLPKSWSILGIKKCC